MPADNARGRLPTERPGHFRSINETVAVYIQACELFVTADCSQEPIDLSETSVLANANLEIDPGPGPASWFTVESRFVARAGAASALCSFAIQPTEDTGVDFELELDQLFLGPVGSGIFEDSFESGGLTAWSGGKP